MTFPVVIKCDGTVWDKAALYLNALAIQRKSSKLVKTVGDDLLDFLRFMETHNIDMLHIPIEKELRVTYRYRQDLLNREKLSRNTAAQRIARIVAFYEYCFDNNLFTKEELKNRLPKKLKDSLFVKRKENRWRKNSQGFGFQIEYEVSDLSIPRTPSAEQSTDAIKDANFLVSGNLQLKDSTKNISFPAKIAIDGAKLSASADFNIDRTQWGMNYKGPNNPQDWVISKQVNLKVNLTATKK